MHAVMILTATLLPPAELPIMAPQRITTPVWVDADVRDCRRLWQALAPWSYDPALCEFFVAEHRRRGIGKEWRYSFCYGFSGSGMVARMTYSAGGMTARGLMDCTELQIPRAEALRRFGTTDLHNERLSIANHCAQAAAEGGTGWQRMRRVFLPGSPEGARAYKEQRRWESIWRRLP